MVLVNLPLIGNGSKIRVCRRSARNSAVVVHFVVYMYLLRHNYTGSKMYGRAGQCTGRYAYGSLWVVSMCRYRLEVVYTRMGQVYYSRVGMDGVGFGDRNILKFSNFDL